MPPRAELLNKQLSSVQSLIEELKEADPYSAASYVDLYNKSEAHLSEWIMVCFPVVLVGYFVFTANKKVSALAQSGSMQSREVRVQTNRPRRTPSIGGRGVATF